MVKEKKLASKNKPKERIDKLLVLKGFATTQEKAQAYVLAGIVFANGKKIEKSGTLVFIDAPLKVKVAPYLWVSRGGVKLDFALKYFQISVQDKICMDIGAGAGGFTDCLLYHGATKVYAIDTGTNQLDWKIRQDKRIVVMEKTNFRYLKREHIPDTIDLTVIDVSFISLDKIFPNLLNFTHDKSDMIALIKPQFEADKGEVPKGGVIHDEKLHFKAIEKIETLCKDLNLKTAPVVPSPILGAQGNKEYLIHVKT